VTVDLGHDRQVHPSLEEMAALLDGQIQGDERARLMAHLASCPSCYELFSETAAHLEAERERGTGKTPWRKTAPWIIPLAAAAAIAALLLWLPGRTPLAGGRANAGIASLVDNLPADKEMRRLLTDLPADHDWPVSRSAGPPEASPDVSFQLGVLVAELDVALLSGAEEVASERSTRIASLVETLPEGYPLALFFREDGISGRLSAGEDPRTLLRMNRQADEALLDFVDEEPYRIGRWAAASNLAAARRHSEFFDSPGFRRGFAAAQRAENLPPEGRAALQAIERSLKEGRDWLTLQRAFEDLIVAGGGG